MAIEEMSELTQALAHAFRGRDHNVIEEIADVMIMCEQLSVIFGKSEVKKHKTAKLNRLYTLLNTTTE